MILAKKGFNVAPRSRHRHLVTILQNVYIVSKEIAVYVVTNDCVTRGGMINAW